MLKTRILVEVDPGILVLKFPDKMPGIIVHFVTTENLFRHESEISCEKKNFNWIG